MKRTRNERKQRIEAAKAVAFIAMLVTMIIVLWFCTIRAFALAAW